jgi:polyribonucleotide nucleotidyltransferase
LLLKKVEISTWFTSTEYEGEKEDEAVYAKVKAAAYDKYYAIAQEASAKSERGEKFALVKEEVKALYTEEEYAENADSRIS